MGISIVRYKVSETGEWEIGLRIESHDNLIIDSNGKLVNEIWDVSDAHQFNINLTPYMSIK